MYQALVASQAAYESTLVGHETALEAAIDTQGPLTISVEIRKNGEYVNTVEIYRDYSPIFTASSTLGLGSVQNAQVDYSQSSGSQKISLDVEASDYIQFIVTAGLTVSGIPTLVDLDDSVIAGFTSGTVTLHSGSITATMG